MKSEVKILHFHDFFTTVFSLNENCLKQFARLFSKLFFSWNETCNIFTIFYRELKVVKIHDIFFEIFFHDFFFSLAERAAEERERKRRELKECIKEIEDPDKQRKMEEREIRRDRKKAAPKMKQMKVKAM